LKNKFLAAIALITILSLYSCASTGGGGDELSLLKAIEQTAEKIATELPSGSRVAVVAFESENDRVSDFIMDEFTGALRDQRLEVADRRALEYVIREQNFQMSGNTSDETSVSVGKFVGAELIVIGQLRYLGDHYRLTTNAIHVETATHAVVPRFDVRNDRAMKNMLTALGGQETTVRKASYGLASLMPQPETSGTFFDRGILFAMEGDLGRSAADLDEAIRLNPNAEGAIIIRTTHLPVSTAEADDAWDRAAARQFQRELDIGLAHIASGNFNDAIAHFSRMASPRGSYFPYLYRGYAYLSRNRRGDIDRAISDFETVLSKDPNNASARQFLTDARQRRR